MADAALEDGHIMGQPFGGGQAAIEVAVVAVPLLMVVGAALYLSGQHRRYGRLADWPGQLTLAALLTGAGLAAYAVWPLPPSADGGRGQTAYAARPAPVSSAARVSWPGQSARRP